MSGNIITEWCRVINLAQMGRVCAVITNTSHVFFMNPRGIINAYQHAETPKERNLLANRFIQIMIKKPVSKNWNFLSDELEPEEWKDIDGFDGKVKISNWGRVKQIGCHGKEISSRQRISSYISFSGQNYPHTRIGSKGNYIPILIHVEVARAFVPNPDNLPIVNHKDGDKNNPYYKNLEWSTVPDNNNHARYTGLNSNIGSGNTNSKITEEDALFIFNSTATQITLAHKFGITQDAVSCIKRGVTWGHVTGKVFKPQKIKNELAIEIFNDMGLTYRELSIKYNVPQSTVGNIKRGLTFSHATDAKSVPSRSAKETGSTYYLGRPKVIEIFKAEGSPKKISKDFGVSVTTVIRIKKRERWADVTKNI